MDLNSTPDINTLDTRELAALQNEILKGVAQAREVTRKGLVLDQQISQARAQRRVMRPNL